MAIVKWYTQPENSFASFYYYDTATLNMVRIRMELGRDGNPKVMAMKDRLVGFGPEDEVEECDMDVKYWCANTRNEIYYQKEDHDDKKYFSSNPRSGDYVVDFTLEDESDDRVHFGNRITNHPELPKCTTDPVVTITEEILVAVARKYIGQDGDTKICDHDDSTCKLARSLEALSRDDAAH